MGKKRRPLPNGHHALRREAEEAARPDRLYPIRSEKYYGFYAGHVPGKRQALVAGDLDLLIAFFEHQGNLLEVQRRTLPPSVKVPEMNCGTLDDRDFQEYLKKEFHFRPGLIRVKAFQIQPEGLAVHPFPSHYQLFLDNPHDGFNAEDRDYYPELIRTWIADKQFVLDWGNDYWLDNNGEVTSS